MSVDPEITDDALLGGRVRLLQPARGYRVAVDAVLLAAAVPAGGGQQVLDVGCGVGAASLCLLARLSTAGVQDVIAVGLEVQAHLADLARRNAERNRMDARFTVIVGDVAVPPAGLGSFDHVFSNPPYLPAVRADPSPDQSKALATVESTAGLAAWIGFCMRVLRPGGTLTLVHRADRRDELLRQLHPHAESIAVMPLLPQAGMTPRRLLLCAHKGTGGAVRDLPGLVLHRAGGSFTPEAEAILRDAAPLAWADETGCGLQTSIGHPT